MAAQTGYEQGNPAYDTALYGSAAFINGTTTIIACASDERLIIDHIHVKAPAAASSLVLGSTTLLTIASGSNTRLPNLFIIGGLGEAFKLTSTAAGGYCHVSGGVMKNYPWHGINPARTRWSFVAGTASAGGGTDTYLTGLGLSPARGMSITKIYCQGASTDSVVLQTSTSSSSITGGESLCEFLAETAQYDGGIYVRPGRYVWIKAIDAGSTAAPFLARAQLL